MGVGIQVFADDGTPQTIDLSYNMVLVATAAVTIGSNSAAVGTAGSVVLASKSEPYLVFIRATGNAAIVSQTTNGFTWHMASGTTSFTYYAYARSANSSKVGLQVFNSDGSMRWHVGDRPLVISALNPTRSGTVTNPGDTPAANVATGSYTYTVPAGCAVLFGQLGAMLNLYAGHPGKTLAPDMRFYPCISLSGTTLTVRYCRRFANRGALPVGVTLNTTYLSSPAILCTNSF